MTLRRVAIHMPGAGEGGFSRPDSRLPELSPGPAGMTLPLNRIVHEALRQHRRGALLLGSGGSGKSRFVDEVVRGRHLPDGLRPVRVAVPADGDPRALRGALQNGADRHLLIVDGFDHIADDVARGRFVEAIHAATERDGNAVWLVTSRFGACADDLARGSHFVEFLIRPLEEDEACAFIAELCARSGVFLETAQLKDYVEALRRERKTASLMYPGPIGELCRHVVECGALPDVNTTARIAAEHGADAHRPAGLEQSELLSAWRASPRGLPADCRISTDDRTGVTYLGIEGGTFLMGSSEDEEGRWKDEGPRHQVRVGRFELAVHPVTNEQYERFLRHRPAALPPAYWGDPRFNGNHQPVVGVTWEDAQAYALWAQARLPSEAEWEYACRAGSGAARYGPLDDIAWWIGNSGRRLHEVCSRAPNAWGLFDTIGNAWEFVEDDRHDSYVGAPIDGSAWIDRPRRPVRLLRGGSWADAPKVVRASTRLTHHPGPRIGNVGFRVARETTGSA